ncbi:Kinesin family 1 [Fasciola gigantica]|uniref:Kinesin-like protein n=1 Tax=Fasciola gigantica TaxID=46835 RepID=A0A504YSZ0_FASGI|nr:Kinesin family 1 [Fasciola gigantica]
MVAPLVDEILTGYNCTIFAYGQTGSGKTFTMTGERSDKLRFAWENDPLVGVIPRALNHLFEALAKSNWDFSVRVSFLEVYNEELFDLLSATEINRLAIYDDANRKGSVVVKGLREVGVLNRDDVYSVIERGLARRQTASTLLNSQSSRSHSIFTVIVHIKEMHPTTGEELLRIGKLHLVDLAGSECIGRSGAIEKRAREAGSINQSLLTLGRVITALVDHAPHIPYRESKLTRLLQDSLGGKTKTSIIATISPSASCLEETLSTLEYAHRAKNIQNRPEINAKLNKTDLVRCYNVELERLRRDLEAARTKTGIFIDEENYKALQAQIEQQRARINDLEERREILEYDLSQLQDMFSSTQTELAESRECRTAIENELIACQSNLEKLHLRLIKTRLRLDEEEHLRREHQKTENTLHEQAEYLLSTSKTAINNMSTLHEKLDTLALIDSQNRERLSHLSSDWAAERLGQPISGIINLQQMCSDFCQSIQTTLSDIRKNEQQSSVLLIERQETLKQQFMDRIVTEWIDAVQKMREFTQDQAQCAERSCEEILLPHCERLKQLCEGFFMNVDTMRGNAAAHHGLIMDFIGRVSGVIDHLGQYASECTESVISQNKFHMETIEKWNHRRAREDSVIQALQRTLNELSGERQQTTELVMEFERCRERATEICQNCVQKLGDAKLQLKLATREAEEAERKIQESHHSKIQEFESRIDSLSSTHEELKNGITVCFDGMRQHALQFDGSDLANGLRLRISEWESGESSDRINGASARFLHLIDATKQSVLDLVDKTTEQTLMAENLNGDASYKFSKEFTDIRDHLALFPNQLEDRLHQDLQQYQSTGVTPQRQTFTLPTKLAQTNSHDHLLAEFRSTRQTKALEEVALTPLPDTNSSFGDSSRNNSVNMVFGPVSLSAEENKENRVNTSGLGSEFSEISLMVKSNIQTTSEVQLPPGSVSNLLNSASDTPVKKPKHRRSRKRSMRKVRR